MTKGNMSMPTSSADSVESLANSFVSYLFDEYKGIRHVRRVASWLGFLLKAIERVAGSTIRKNYTRQIIFEYRGHQFKAKYNHKAGTRGGIDIVEVLPGRGSREGKLAIRMTNLAEAEQVYHSLERQLNSFIKSLHASNRR
jgi:hypothetical protein